MNEKFWGLQKLYGGESQADQLSISLISCGLVDVESAVVDRSGLNKEVFGIGQAGVICDRMRYGNPV